MSYIITNSYAKPALLTIENHFNLNTTYIVGNVITNGCQTFLISDIDKVCEQFTVMQDMKSNILDLHSNMNFKKEDIEQLAYHTDWKVRIAVAKQGLMLDYLINDSSSLAVRQKVAEVGYGLDILINDKSSHVRIAVAHQGFGLDKLINDTHSNVRAAVAEMGFGLDILCRDKNDTVRDCANKIINWSY